MFFLPAMSNIYVAVLVILGIIVCGSGGQHFMYNLPGGSNGVLKAPIKSTFHCNGLPYGYYADIDNDCKVFHLCVPVVQSSGQYSGNSDRGHSSPMTMYSFLCASQTVFDQSKLVCSYPSKSVKCGQSVKYVSSNERMSKYVKSGDSTVVLPEAKRIHHPKRNMGAYRRKVYTDAPLLRIKGPIRPKHKNWDSTKVFQRRRQRSKTKRKHGPEVTKPSVNVHRPNYKAKLAYGNKSENRHLSYSLAYGESVSTPSKHHRPSQYGIQFQNNIQKNSDVWANSVEDNEFDGNVNGKTSEKELKIGIGVKNQNTIEKDIGLSRHVLNRTVSERTLYFSPKSTNFKKKEGTVHSNENVPKNSGVRNAYQESIAKVSQNEQSEFQLESPKEYGKQSRHPFSNPNESKHDSQTKNGEHFQHGSSEMTKDYDDFYVNSRRKKPNPAIDEGDMLKTNSEYVQKRDSLVNYTDKEESREFYHQNGVDSFESSSEVDGIKYDVSKETGITDPESVGTFFNSEVVDRVTHNDSGKGPPVNKLRSVNGSDSSNDSVEVFYGSSSNKNSNSDEYWIGEIVWKPQILPIEAYKDILDDILAPKDYEPYQIKTNLNKQLTSRGNEKGGKFQRGANQNIITVNVYGQVVPEDVEDSSGVGNFWIEENSNDDQSITDNKELYEDSIPDGEFLDSQITQDRFGENASRDSNLDNRREVSAKYVEEYLTGESKKQNVGNSLGEREQLNELDHITYDQGNKYVQEPSAEEQFEKEDLFSEDPQRDGNLKNGTEPHVKYVSKYMIVESKNQNASNSPDEYEELKDLEDLILSYDLEDEYFYDYNVEDLFENGTADDTEASTVTPKR